MLILLKELHRDDVMTKQLARFLSANGIEVNIICFGDKENSYTLEEEGQKYATVHTVTLMVHADNLFNWTMLMNNELKKRGRQLFDEHDYDIIHGNDWMTAPAAMTLKKYTKKPLVMTINSTEHERGFGGVHGSMISDLEWWSGFEADHIIVNKKSTLESLKHDLKIPQDKLSLISGDSWCDKVLEIYFLVTKVDR